MTSRSSSGALEAVERILNRGGEPADVLGDVVNSLNERAAAWVGIAFVDEGGARLGPNAGGTKPADHQRYPITWERQPVAELWTSAEADPALCARVAVIISPYCRRF
jgi:hypothetical protein